VIVGGLVWLVMSALGQVAEQVPTVAAVSTENLIITTASAQVQLMDVGEQAVIDTTGPHAWVKHGPAEVEEVHQAIRIKAAEDPQWFDRPPCKDGRYRWILRLAGNNRWAVQVCELITEVGNVKYFAETTAFVSDQDYAKGVADGCGNGWMGGSFAQ